MGFASFLVRRILLGIVVLWFVTVATFLLFFVAPQDPARLLAGKSATAAQIADINRRLGLDQPLIVQYWHYLDRLLHGNLGTSYLTGSLGQHHPQAGPAAHPVAAGRRRGALAHRRDLGGHPVSATRARTLLDRISTTGVLDRHHVPHLRARRCCCCSSSTSRSTRHGFHWIQTGYEGRSRRASAAGSGT